MTLRNSETLARTLVALALGIGFVGFATHAHGSRTAGRHEAAVHVAATPVVDGAAHAGI